MRRDKLVTKELKTPNVERNLRWNSYIYLQSLLLRWESFIRFPLQPPPGPFATTAVYKKGWRPEIRTHAVTMSGFNRICSPGNWT
jgi:hypothetical protein